VARARNALLGLLGLVVAGNVAGQVPVDSGLPGRLRVNASGLRPSELVYDMTLERDAGTTLIGTRTVSVTPMTYAGTPAWLLLESRSTDGTVGSDSLVADTAALRPLHWGSAIGEARLATEFRVDSAFGGTSGPPGRRSIVAATPPGTLVSGAMLETVLRLVPLSATWEDSATTLSVTLGGNANLPTRLAVIGEDQVRVPAGTFDCWVVAVHTDQSRGLYWVTKVDPIVVRTVLDVPSLGGAQLVSALTRIAR